MTDNNLIVTVIIVYCLVPFLTGFIKRLLERLPELKPQKEPPLKTIPIYLSVQKDSGTGDLVITVNTEIEARMRNLLNEACEVHYLSRSEKRLTVKDDEGRTHYNCVEIRLHRMDEEVKDKFISMVHYAYRQTFLSQEKFSEN